MALDIAKIRARLDSVKNNGKAGGSFWRPQDGTQVMSGTGVVQEVADQAGGVAVAAGAANEIFVLVGETYATVADIQTGLETGDHELTLSAAADQWDAFITVYSDGTDAHVAIAVADTAPGTDFIAGDLTVLDVAIIKGTGVITAGEFVTANFDIV